MKKKIMALLCAMLMLLSTGCAGTIDGRDTIEVAQYSNNKKYSRPFSSINTVTKVTHCCADFINLVKAGNYQEALAMTTISDMTFVTPESVLDYVTASGMNLNEEITYTEYTQGGNIYVDCATSTGKVTLEVANVIAEDGTESWTLTLPDFLVENYKIIITDGIACTLDGKDISTYKQENGDYIIPSISSGLHTMVLSNAFTTGITVSVDTSTGVSNLTDYLYVEEPMRSQLIDLASSTLVTLNNTIIANDWEKFKGYFTPGKNMADYSSKFLQGYETKAAAYDLVLLETRNLELSDLDVRYTGYNTVEMTFGTRWTWASPSDYFVNEVTKEVTVYRQSEMRVKNVVELYYDVNNNCWYVENINEDSILRLANNLEQWR